jgi:hypothetical protein
MGRRGLRFCFARERRGQGKRRVWVHMDLVQAALDKLMAKRGVNDAKLPHLRRTVWKLLPLDILPLNYLF